jgi:mRNA interferase MazF
MFCSRIVGFMKKDFDRWNNSKKKINQKSHVVNFHEREIWWCAIGLNIGSEQDSDSGDFSRPVIIVKKFTERIFWGVPLTTTIVTGSSFRIPFNLNGIKNDMLVMQMRTFDKSRLVRRMGTLGEPEFARLCETISNVLPEREKTPFGVSSEAEARVYELSIEHQAILSRFYGDRFSDRLRIYTKS